MDRRRAFTAAGLVLACAIVVATGGCSAAPQAAAILATDPDATPVMAVEATPVPSAEATAAPGNEATPLPSAEATAAASDEAAMETADTATDAAASPVTSVTPAPSPGLSTNARNASPSPVASPAAASARKAPTPTAPPAEVVAVGMADDHRIAEIDPATGKVLRFVEFSGPSGRMASAPDGQTAWVFKPGATAASIAVFDMLSGNRRQDVRFREADRPVAAAFSTDGSLAYVAAGGAVVYATSAGKEFGRVMLGQQSPGVHVTRNTSAIAISPGSGGDTVYVAGQSSGLVWVLDGTSGAVLSEINVGGGPLNITVDPARQRAYVLLDTLNQLVAIDTSTYAVASRLQLPARPFDATLRSDGTLFVLGGDTEGQVWVVSPLAAEIRAQVPGQGRPVGLAMSRDGKSLYIPDAENRRLSILSADTVQVMRSISLPSAPASVVVSRPATASVDPKATPQATPSLIPTPTPPPKDAIPPERLPSGSIAEPFVPGANDPAALAFAPDGRLFYTELRTGKIRIVKDGVLLRDPFYQLLVAAEDEGGLVGLALDPDFANSHYVYVMYTTPTTSTDGGSASSRNQIARLTDTNDKGTELQPILKDLPTTNGEGALRFGPDGKLYVSVADDQKGARTQDLNSLTGKILRVNSDGSTPNDNPFVGQSGKQELIWAFGLRGAQSLAFHPLGGQMLAAVSGQGDQDAIDLIVRGGNYGWPSSTDRPVAGVIAPLEIAKPSIRPTGSTFYMGEQLAEWKNDWFYCNSAQGQLRRVRLADQSFDRIASEEIVRQGCTHDVATGPDGGLYYSDATGIYRIRMRGADALPAVKAVAP